MNRASGRGRGSAQACRAGTGKAEKSEPCARAKALVLASLRRSEHPSPRVSKKHQAPRASRAPRGQGAGVRRPERTSVREDLRTGPATPTPRRAAAREPGSGRRIAGVRNPGCARGVAVRLPSSLALSPAATLAVPEASPFGSHLSQSCRMHGAAKVRPPMGRLTSSGSSLPWRGSSWRGWRGSARRSRRGPHRRRRSLFRPVTTRIGWRRPPGSALHRRRSRP